MKRKHEPSSGDELFDGPSFHMTEARARRARELTVAGRLRTDSHGRRSWRDEETTGLTLTVNGRSGSTAWVFVGKVAGKAVRRTLGAVEVVNLIAAREAVVRLRHDRSFAGVLFPRRAIQADDAGDATASPLVRNVADAALAAHAAGRWLPGTRTRTPGARTMQNYHDVRAAQLRDHEQLTLQAFAEKLPAIYAALQARAPIQGNRFLQLVRNIFAYAIDAGEWTGANPAIGATRTSRLTRAPELPRTRVLSNSEWERLVMAMQAFDPLWSALFAMSIASLQRMAACTHARWADMTLAGADAVWKIPAKLMKGRRAGHIIPLGAIPELLAILRARRKVVPKSCPWVFAGADGEPIRNVDKAWKKIIVAAGLWSADREQRIRPHDLRRTGGARMTTAGVPLGTVCRALGNAASSAVMVARTYAVTTDDALKAAFSAASKRSRSR